MLIMNYKAIVRNITITTALFAGVTLNSVATADAEVSFVDIPNTFTNETLENSKLFIPDGNGPFPAVVIMHGSGGLWSNNNVNSGVMTTHFEEWGTRLQMNGYVALFIDSYTPRGVVEFHERRPAQDPAIDDAACSNRHVRPQDAYSALEWLQDQSYIIDNRVALMGFSQGGESTLVSVTDETIPQMQNDWTVRRLNWDDTVTNIVADAPYTVPDGQGFKTAVAYYPGCGFYNYFGQSSVAAANRYMPSCPTFVLHGTEDGLYSKNLYPEVLRDKSMMHAVQLNQADTTYPWTDMQNNHLTGTNPLWHQTYNNVGHSFDELDNNDVEYPTKLEAIDDVMTWLNFYLKDGGVVNSAVGDWLNFEGTSNTPGVPDGLTVTQPGRRTSGLLLPAVQNVRSSTRTSRR